LPERENGLAMVRQLELLRRKYMGSAATHKITRRRALGIAGTLLAGPILASCAPAATPTPAAAKPADKPAAAAPAPAKPAEKPAEAPKPAAAGQSSSQLKPAKLTFWMQEWKDGVAVMKDAAEGFHKQFPAYEVEVLPIPFADLQNKFYPALASKTSGEVLYTYTDWWGPVDAGKVLRPLTPGVFTGQEAQAAFFPATLQAVRPSKEGHFYVAPLITGMDGVGMLVNGGEAAKLGIDVEKLTSWEAVEDAAKKAMTRSGDQITRAGMTFWTGTSALALFPKAFIQEQGGQYYDPKTQKFNWQTPEATKAFTFIADMFKKYDSFEFEKTIKQPLITGASVIDFSGLFMVSGYGGQDPNVDIVPLPRPAFPGAGKPVYQISAIGSLAIPAWLQDEKLSAATEFVKYLIKPKNMAQFGKFYSGSIAVQDVYKEPEYQESKWGKKVASWVPTKAWPFVRFDEHHVNALENQIIKPAVEAIVTGAKTVEQALADLTKRTNELEQEALQRLQAG
jgi:multiple sugar transport system substrate-binding protein